MEPSTSGSDTALQLKEFLKSSLKSESLVSWAEVRIQGSPLLGDPQTNLASPSKVKREGSWDDSIAPWAPITLSQVIVTTNKQQNPICSCLGWGGVVSSCLGYYYILDIIQKNLHFNKKKYVSTLKSSLQSTMKAHGSCPPLLMPLGYSFHRYFYFKSRCMSLGKGQY